MLRPMNADIFKALADDTRLRIVALLLAEQELCVCDLISALQLPQSTVSRHLGYLRRAGIVKDRRCGLWIYYSIADSDHPFYGGLLRLLKENLAQFPAASEDRASLQRFGKGNDCA